MKIGRGTLRPQPVRVPGDRLDDEPGNLPRPLRVENPRVNVTVTSGDRPDAGLALLVAGLAGNDPPGGEIGGSELLAPGNHDVLLLVFADEAVARDGLPSCRA